MANAHMEIRWNFGVGKPPGAADWAASVYTYYLNIWVGGGPFVDNVQPPGPPNHTNERLKGPDPWAGTRLIDAPEGEWFLVAFFVDTPGPSRWRASKAFQAANNFSALFQTSDLVDIGWPS